MNFSYFLENSELIFRFFHENAIRNSFQKYVLIKNPAFTLNWTYKYFNHNKCYDSLRYFFLFCSKLFMYNYTFLRSAQSRPDRQMEKLSSESPSKNLPKIESISTSIIIDDTVTTTTPPSTTPTPIDPHKWDAFAYGSLITVCIGVLCFFSCMAYKKHADYYSF